LLNQENQHTKGVRLEACAPGSFAQGQGDQGAIGMQEHPPVPCVIICIIIRIQCVRTTLPLVGNHGSYSNELLR